MVYSGPIIDSHHHLWRLRPDFYQIFDESNELTAPGAPWASLRRDYLLTDFENDVRVAPNVVGSVHVEVGLKDGLDASEEVAWVRFERGDGPLATRLVAGADFRRDDVEALLEEYASSPDVAGIRQTIRVDDATGESPWPGFVDDERWVSAIAACARLGLTLDLLAHSSQADQIATVAMRFPHLRIVVDHAALHRDITATGLAAWRAALTTMAGQANVYLKLSSLQGVTRQSSAAVPDAVIRLAEPALDAFGASRTMFGSDFPVNALVTDYASVIRDAQTLAENLDEADQRRFFFETAASVYGFALDTEKSSV